MELEETFFLHGLAVKEEVFHHLLSKQRKGQGYLASIKHLTSRWNTVPNLELALSVVDFETYEFLAKHFELRVLHAPFVDALKTIKLEGAKRFIDITDFSNQTLQSLRLLLKTVIRTKSATSPVTIIFHPLPYTKDILEENLLISNMHKLFRKVCPLLVDHNIFLTIENMPFLTGVLQDYSNIIGRIEFFEYFFEGCSCPNIGMTFDFGHANSMARVLWQQGELSDTQLNSFVFPLDFMKKLASRIYHIHFHYNPAHIPEARPFITRTFLKFQNYDVHDRIYKYNSEEWVALQKGFEYIKRARTHNKLMPTTVTLEVMPRALDSLSAYIKDMQIFKKQIMLEYPK